MKHLKEDMRRLGLTIGIVAVVIVLGAWLEHSTHLIRSHLNLASEGSPVLAPLPSAAAPSPTAE